jgi:hypothetical protein
MAPEYAASSRQFPVEHLRDRLHDAVNLTLRSFLSFLPEAMLHWRENSITALQR